MSEMSTVSRIRHTDLHPLSTSIVSQTLGKRRGSSQSSSSSTNSTATLPSPSIVAARAYYLENETPIGPKLNAQQRRRSLFEVHQFPRRHSAVAIEGDLAAQLECFTFSPKIKLQTVSETPESVPEIKVEEAPDVNMTGNYTKRNDLVKIGKIASRRKSDDLLVAASDVPFLYIHDRLRDWGGVYLGNTATADAFVNAVSVRRPSLALAKEDVLELLPRSSNLVTIRARVVPKAKERKAFLIQRQFDIEDLRAGIPRSRNRSEGASPPRLGGSSRQRRSSAQPLSSDRRGSTESRRGDSLYHLGKGAVPIRKYISLASYPNPADDDMNRYRICTSLSTSTGSPHAIRPR
jgi:hypothetical protein